MRIKLATCLAILVAATIQGQTMAESSADMAMDFDAVWDYNDPAATRTRFEQFRNHATDSTASYRLQLATQIARTYGLEGDFKSAHGTLDEVEGQLRGAASVERVRFLLERGRAHRSNGETDKALPLFEQAYDMGRLIRADYHAIDAAHMMAIAADSTQTRRAWSRKGIDIAEASTQTRARHWLGSIYNNLGWDHHGDGEFDAALELFQKALVARQQEAEAGPIAIAHWCVARCMRSVGRLTEALEIQQQLLADHEAAGTGDGYVSEELGELHLALGNTQDAARHFAEAYRKLSQDSWFAAHETERLQRLKDLSQQ